MGIAAYPVKFEGIYTPVITPFQSDYGLDREGYARVIEAQIALGVQGIVIGGTTGENYALTPEERVWQFSFAHDVIGGRLPWLAGVNDIRTETVCDFAVAAREAGGREASPSAGIIDSQSVKTTESRSRRRPRRTSGRPAALSPYSMLYAD